jgi:hypothetical protein
VLHNALSVMLNLKVSYVHSIPERVPQLAVTVERAEN